MTHFFQPFSPFFFPLRKCHTKLPPHNFVTHLSNPHPPKNRGVLLTTIRHFTEQHMIEATLQFSPQWTQMFVYRDNSNLFFTVVDRLSNRIIRRVYKLFIQPFDVHSTFYFFTHAYIRIDRTPPPCYKMSHNNNQHLDSLFAETVFLEPLFTGLRKYVLIIYLPLPVTKCHTRRTPSPPSSVT